MPQPIIQSIDHWVDRSRNPTSSTSSTSSTLPGLGTRIHSKRCRKGWGTWGAGAESGISLVI
ncbi:MAG: hypothetical protein MUF72_04505 [Elainella sp. Prado103]|nr:hypothetical protein [Elainella sp. Prado103]